MSVDIKQALRPVLCLANPSRMQAARWERLDTKQALRPVSCLPNPSELRPKEVPAGQGGEVGERGHKIGPAAYFDRRARRPAGSRGAGQNCLPCETPRSPCRI